MSRCTPKEWVDARELEAWREVRETWRVVLENEFVDVRLTSLRARPLRSLRRVARATLYMREDPDLT